MIWRGERGILGGGRLPDAEDAATHIVGALHPRILVTFGVDPVPACPPDCHVYQLDTGAAERNRDAFFARIEGKATERRDDRRPPIFDLAIVASHYRLSERRAILAALKPMAHSASVVLLLRRETAPGRRAASARALRRLVAARLRGLSTALCIAPEPGLLVGDLDVTRARSSRSWRGRLGLVRTGAQPLDGFLADRAIERRPHSRALRPSPGAPRAEAGLAHPACRNIAAADLARQQGNNKRWLGSWWNRPVRLIDIGIDLAEDVGFLQADGGTAGLLVAADGLPLAAGERQILGYTPDGSGIETDQPPRFIVDRGGRRHPPQAARSHLDGRFHAGDHLLLGSMDRRFGHFLLETLATAWAVDWALAHSMRIVIWGGLRPFHRSALQLLGIPPGGVVRASAGDRFERLHMPTPAFRLIGSASPVAARGWERIGEAACTRDGLDPLPPHRFVYLSRAGVEKRALRNEAAVEAVMAARGGLVARPELMRFEDQVRLARDARALVGCFGSQLHLSAFQRPGARKLVIGTDQFTGPDETLISLANGTEVSYFIQLDRVRGMRARTAAWTLDLERFVPAFDRWLAEDPDGGPRPSETLDP